MKVDLYSVDTETKEKMIEARNVELATCFPEDDEDATKVEAELVEKGEAYFGGGAAALFYFVRAQ